MALGLQPICIPAAIRFIANTPSKTRAGVVSFVVVRAIPPKKPPRPLQRAKILMHYTTVVPRGCILWLDQCY
jgi:hypothetical protein